ncbi:F0F1 ATP synthase subunit B family protein [Candidatus Cytomitobacter primus]|uniref:ATP synthase YMF19-like N-terminal domain-containing protein n=1 Tax=Candidatus Cytomitobacter primus TaxID=2066024 RepID=A0A5C0UFU8_9PROT|nr:hypothetical protein [Candidatus Cytomitobacter primus]QEK38513.1 hypothetical protein FZC34_01150 [Candidatus Cytomitobacter primus]
MALIPQIDIYWFVSQIFWVSISFSVLIVLMYMFFVPSIMNSMIKRNSHIKDLQNKIEELNDDITVSQNIIKKYQYKMDTLIDENLVKISNEFDTKYKEIIKSRNIENEIRMKKHTDDLDKWGVEFTNQLKPEIAKIALKVVQKICQ